MWPHNAQVIWQAIDNRRKSTKGKTERKIRIYLKEQNKTERNYNSIENIMYVNRCHKLNNSGCVDDDRSNTIHVLDGHRYIEECHC